MLISQLLLGHDLEFEKHDLRDMFIYLLGF